MSSVWDKISSFRPSTSSAASAILSDNIFVPIQADGILPQIPIGQQHPVPHTGIEDDDTRMLYANNFYANTFLGEQNQPVWTHPYALWWGKGRREGDQFATWGMNVGHVELEDFVAGEGPVEPASSLH